MTTFGSFVYICVATCVLLTLMFQPSSASRVKSMVNKIQKQIAPPPVPQKRPKPPPTVDPKYLVKHGKQEPAVDGKSLRESYLFVYGVNYTLAHWIKCLVTYELPWIPTIFLTEISELIPDFELSEELPEETDPSCKSLVWEVAVDRMSRSKFMLVKENFEKCEIVMKKYRPGLDLFDANSPNHDLSKRLALTYGMYMRYGIFTFDTVSAYIATCQLVASEAPKVLDEQGQLYLARHAKWKTMLPSPDVSSAVDALVKTDFTERFAIAFSIQNPRSETREIFSKYLQRGYIPLHVCRQDYEVVQLRVCQLELLISQNDTGTLRVEEKKGDTGRKSPVTERVHKLVSDKIMPFIGAARRMLVVSKPPKKYSFYILMYSVAAIGRAHAYANHTVQLLVKYMPYFNWDETKENELDFKLSLCAKLLFGISTETDRKYDEKIPWRDIQLAAEEANNEAKWYSKYSQLKSASFKE